MTNTSIAQQRVNDAVIASKNERGHITVPINVQMQKRQTDGLLLS